MLSCSCPYIAFYWKSSYLDIPAIWYPPNSYILIKTHQVLVLLAFHLGEKVEKSKAIILQLITTDGCLMVSKTSLWDATPSKPPSSKQEQMASGHLHGQFYAVHFSALPLCTCAMYVSQMETGCYPWARNLLWTQRFSVGEGIKTITGTVSQKAHWKQLHKVIMEVRHVADRVQKF